MAAHGDRVAGNCAIIPAIGATVFKVVGKNRADVAAGVAAVLAAAGLRRRTGLAFTRDGLVDAIVADGVDGIQHRVDRGAERGTGCLGHEAFTPPHQLHAAAAHAPRDGLPGINLAVVVGVRAAHPPIPAAALAGGLG